MKRFTDAGRRAIAEGNLYAGLSLALMLPDICASLEDPGPGKSQTRYIRWCKEWVEPKFPFSRIRGQSFVSAEDCYQLRCSLIHSGSAEIDSDRKQVISRFEFFDSAAGSHLNFIHEVVQLKVDLFSKELFKAADEWDIANESNASVQSEKARLLVIRSAGFTIGGMRFG